MSIMLMTTSIGGSTGPLSAAARAAGAATIFYTILDAPRPDRSGVKHPEVSASEDLVLDHVNFAYPTRPDLKVLDDLTLCLPSGTVTAIVGPSGSGKSTIVGLLERWYEIESPDSGHPVCHPPSSTVLNLQGPPLIADPRTSAERSLAQRLHHCGWSALERG
jgi:ABC-type multidrug transport system fused ATPase/permease subunit